MKSRSSAAVKLARKVFADGGDVYQSTGDKLVEDGKVNWGNPDLAADFFRADAAQRALNLAKSEGTTPEDTTSVKTTPSSSAASTSSASGGTSPRDVAAMPALKTVNVYEAGLLNALSAPESAGAYNIRYTPSGGTTFDSYADHPRVYEPTKTGEKSSAAGRYQFTYNTWMSLPEEYRKDFTPATQDKAALYYAKSVYNADTGRDLFSDLQKYGFTPKIAQTLGTVWSGVADNPSKSAAAYKNTLARLSGATPRKSGGAVKRKHFDEGGEAAGGTEPTEVSSPAPAQQAQAPTPQPPIDQVPLPPEKPAYLQSFDYSKYDNPLDARYAFLSQTLNPTIAAAALGNFGIESWNNPNQLQTRSGTPEGTPIFDKNQMPLGYGSAQWGGVRLTNPTGDPNKMGLFDFAKEYGFDPNSTEGQDRFFVYELTQNPEYKSTYSDMMKAGNDLNKVTSILGDEYESPKNLTATLGDRQVTAQMFHNYYNDRSALEPGDYAEISKTINGMMSDPMFQSYAANKSNTGTMVAQDTGGIPGIQQAGLDTQSQQDAINAAQQAAVQQSQNFDTGIVQNAATDFNYLNPLQGTGIGDWTNMFTGVDYWNPPIETPTPSITDFSYNAFDPGSSWSAWTPERRGGRVENKYMTGGNVPAAPARRDSWIDRTNKELQKQYMSPEQEDETSERLEGLQDDKSLRRMFADGGKVEQYPLQNPKDWKKHQEYKQTGGKIVHMSPQAFLEKTQTVEMTDKSKKAIKHFKKKIKNGKFLGPLAIFPAGGQDGRHRAHAAIELGIKSVPVIVWPDRRGNGSLVKKAISLTSKKA